MKWSRWLLLLCLAAALGIAACGDDDDEEESAGSGASTTAQESAAQAAGRGPAARPRRRTSRSTSRCRRSRRRARRSSSCSASCRPARATPAREGGHRGARLEPTSRSSRTPRPPPALEQAVAQKPDYIFISGIPVAVLKEPLAKAKPPSIPVISARRPGRARRLTRSLSRSAARSCLTPRTSASGSSTTPRARPTWSR